MSAAGPWNAGEASLSCGNCDLFVPGGGPILKHVTSISAPQRLSARPIQDAKQSRVSDTMVQERKGSRAEPRRRGERNQQQIPEPATSAIVARSVSEGRRQTAQTSSRAGAGEKRNPTGPASRPPSWCDAPIASSHAWAAESWVETKSPTAHRPRRDTRPESIARPNAAGLILASARIPPAANPRPAFPCRRRCAGDHGERMRRSSWIFAGG